MMRELVSLLLTFSGLVGALTLPSDQNIEDENYDNYSNATVIIGFILLLHVVFVYEWNYRICRKEIQSCYQTLVVERKIHLLIVSLISHAAASNQVSSDNGGVCSIRTFYDSICKGGSLSGFPLLAWSSHLLWKVRLLEQNEASKVDFCRLCLSLLSTAIALEMIFVRFLYVKSRSIPISSSSALTGSLLALYYIESNSTYSVYDTGIIGDFVVLTALASTFHLFGSTMGVMSGLLHASKITNFLVQPYWSNLLSLTIFLGCCISVKASTIASGITDEDYLPWIDYVSSRWNGRGEQQQHQQLNNNSYGEVVSQDHLNYNGSDNMESGLLPGNSFAIQHGANDSEQRQIGPRSRQRPFTTSS